MLLHYILNQNSGNTNISSPQKGNVKDKRKRGRQKELGDNIKMWTGLYLYET